MFGASEDKTGDGEVMSPQKTTAARDKRCISSFDSMSGERDTSRLRESLLEIGNDIVDVLDADRETHQTGRDAAGDLGLGAALGMGRLRGVNREGLGITELLGICFFIPSAPFPPKAQGRSGSEGVEFHLRRIVSGIRRDDYTEFSTECRQRPYLTENSPNSAHAACCGAQDLSEPP